MNIIRGSRKVTMLIPNVLSRTATFKSSISLENLHPNSNQALYTPSPPVPAAKEFTGYIPLDQLEITYSKSTGPGGQNVNKVNTKVDVRFKICEAKWISEEVRNKIALENQSKITKEGYLIFKSDLTRSQQLNLADCLEKIRTFVRNASVERPQLSVETEEKIRRRLERAARERLANKRERSEVKNERRANIVV